jgi:predicted unusual protein kinase regulating ubiquinone biosynthesis (AarF/ABC1/UbiB family)
VVLPLDTAGAVVNAEPELRAGQRLYRARRIGATFGRTYLGIRTHRFIANHLAPPDMQERWSRLHRDSAREIYATAVELRGLILKACQFLGTRADVLPPEYVDVLSRLQDKVPHRPWSLISTVIRTQLGAPVEQLFSRFERTPIGAASLAQVHRATRRDDGREVAVKVQYPEIGALVRSDLASLRFLFRALCYVERDFDLMPLIDELHRTVPLELDFLNEGRNAERIAGFFADRDDVHVPAIHWDLSRERVLVMDYEPGIKLSDADALRAAGVDLDQLSALLVSAYCEQILTHGFFHADPHPGNLVVQPRPEGPRLVFLDFGLAKELPEGFRTAVLDFAGALLRGDTDAMTAAMQRVGFETRDGSVQGLHEIARFVLASAQRVREQAHLDRELAEKLRAELPAKIRANPLVRVPSHLVLVGRVVGLLSGLTRSLETRADLVRAILPYALGATRSRPPRA